MFKRCYKCGITKDITLFGQNKSKKDGLASECKDCKRSADLAYAAQNREKAKLKSAQWYLEKKEKALQSMKIHGKRWREENKGRWNAKAARYRAQKHQATPSWLSSEHLKEIEVEYLLASWSSQVMKTSYHVDHIVPLRGKDVCGLHVPWNLRVIPASVNISKGNKNVV